MKWIGIDTEFNNTQEEFVNPVCVSIRTESGVTNYWYDELDRFKKDFELFVSEGFYVISFMAAAEFRFLLSIGYNREFLKQVKMIDLYPMWRIVLFGIDDYNWGKYVIIENGKKIAITTRPPRDGELEDGVYYEDRFGNEYKADNIKTRRYNPSLAHACLRLLDIDIETEHKDKMRELILLGDIEDNKEAIMDYCASDTENLYPLLNKLISIIKKYDKSYDVKDILSYGKWMLSVACIENNGVPVDVDKIKNFASNYLKLSVDIPTQCNKVYPFFRWDDKQKRFIKDYDKFAEFVEKLGIAWPLTPKGKYSCSSKTLKSFEVSFPEVRNLYATISALREISYFSPKRVQKILKNIGKDNRWRGSLMPYGTLTSRCTPKPAEGYLFGMSRWLRNLVGGRIIGGDYSAEEIYIQALVSGDESFMECYLSGDPYTWFASKSKALPDNTIKKEDGFYTDGMLVSKELQGRYKSVRSLYKAILLGVGYMMGPDKLSLHLTGASIDALPNSDRIKLLSGDRDILERTVIVGRDREALYPDEQKASYYLNLYKRTFPTYDSWRSNIFDRYKADGCLKLKDGWLLIGSNRSQPPVVNFPIQGEGQVILRKAVNLCLDMGLKVITTLHDAIYIELLKDDDDKILEDCMKKAAYSGMRVDVHEQKIDWENFKSNWSDEKGYEEFTRFGKYFLKNNI